MFLFFFFNDTATTEIYTLSLHDALPIWRSRRHPQCRRRPGHAVRGRVHRSEEHTSELQSQSNLVCRLLLEKKKNILRGPFHFTPSDYTPAGGCASTILFTPRRHY